MGHRRLCSAAVVLVAMSLLLFVQLALAVFPPNHFLGTCLTKEWVKSMEDQLGVASSDRDKLNRLVHPFLRPALQHPRYHVSDPRTARNDIYGNCMTAGSIYGVGAELDANGKVTKQGKINSTLVVELHGWTTHTIASNVFAILAAEVYGYEVTFFFLDDYIDTTQRMSFVRSGLCTPVHVNIEVWSAGIGNLLERYANESVDAGGIGYFGRSGLYTTRDFGEEMLNTTTYPTGPFYATYWNGYKLDEPLIQRVALSTLTSNTNFFPPTEVGCADGSLGCLNHCSKSAACTARENTASGNKECLVVVMMYDYSDAGYLQAVMSNIGIPAYFCFLGYNGAMDYVVYAQKNKIPVLFYHYEPDPFHIQYDGLFDRVYLPRSVPERVELATSTFGELGYGKATTNPIDVDFPYTKLTKYMASVLTTLDEDGPAASLISKLSLSELNINDLLRKQNAITASADAPSAEFQASCQWLKENYSTWKLWLERLPLCTLDQHIDFRITGCEVVDVAAGLLVDRTTTVKLPSLSAAGVRTITFAWKTPDPTNASLPYACDGGLTEYPPPLQTSRSCAWLLGNAHTWEDWIDSKPVCDATFYDYNVSTCDASAKRTVQYYWLLPDPLDATKSLECDATSVQLPADVLVDCEYLPFSTPLFQAVAVIDSIIIAAIVGLMVFVFVCRKAPIIKRSQFELLLLMLAGCVLVCLSALAYAGEPSDFLCAARPLLVSSGFTTIFGALFVKSLRVYRVFMKSAMKRVTITMRKMAKVLAVFYAVDALILGVWFIADFPNPTVTLEEAKEFRGTVNRIACVSNNFIFSALLMFWKAIVLLLGIYTSFLIRNVSADFQESIWIFSSSVMVLVGCLVILPLAYLVDMPAAPFYGFLAGSLLICTVIVASLMLVPKVFRLHAESTPSSLSKHTNAASIRVNAAANAGNTTVVGRASGDTSDDPSTTNGTTKVGDKSLKSASGGVSSACMQLTSSTVARVRNAPSTVQPIHETKEAQ